ncbi:MAG: TFIIB-type zinc ribbon-containing protein [Clostridia bacterium]|nr:TFIIB-type zinc ribbon-containing protein [Clostridia bacterium]
MKCPRCKTVNDNKRTICTKCGYYLYRNSTTPRSMMTKAEIAALDRKLMWNKVKKVLTWVWRILVILAVTYWIIALIVFATSGLGVKLF